MSSAIPYIVGKVKDNSDTLKRLLPELLLYVGMFKPHHLDGSQAAVEPSYVAGLYTEEEYAQTFTRQVAPLFTLDDAYMRKLSPIMSLGHTLVQLEYARLQREKETR